MNRTELEARVVVLERLVIALIRRLDFSEIISAEDLEVIVSGAHGEGDAPSVEYVVGQIDAIFPQPGTERSPISLQEAMRRHEAAIAERRRVFGPPDE
ncbi:hypothetical protein V5F38_05240 [Xanthobacter sp. V0B-10]|uniref:hypothetical protein n=1 Tax=Xanthobacter albus TaxID=3119929 RepID=UPI00372C7F83